MFPNTGGAVKQCPVYQIDFTAVASGKRIASSKRRIRWRFGYANQDALAAGQTGTDCRGQEHDVTIVWSITSGKRLVLMDGKEIHFSSNRNNLFEFNWTMKGNHVLKVVANAQPPMSAAPGFRQYDLFVDGQSFFTFPKVFRLGLAPNDPRGVSGSSSSRRRQPRAGYGNSSSNNSIKSSSNSNKPYDYGVGGGDDMRSTRSGRSMNSSNNIAAIEAPHNPEEEDAYLRQAIENSLKDSSSPARPAPAPNADTLLLDFMSAPAAASYSSGPAPHPALPPSTSRYPGDMYGAPPPQQPAYAALPPSTTAPAPPPQQQQQQQQMGSVADPWGMASLAGSLPPSSQPAVAQLSPYTAPPAVAVAQQPPAQDPYGFAAAPPQLGSPMPTSVNAPPPDTPGTQASTIGFSSPMAQPFRPPEQQTQPIQPQQLQLGMEQQQRQHQQPPPHQGPEPQQVPEPAPAPAPLSDPAGLSMNVLSGQAQPLVTETMTNGTNGQASRSMADQAYAKLVNLDAFDLVQDKSAESRKNPFDEAGATYKSIGSTNQSLADMKKAKTPSEPKKSVMNTPAPAPGAMVLSNTQQGNFGGYGGIAGGMGMMGQQQQQPTMGMMGQQHQQPTMGMMGQQPPPLQQQGYGGMQQQGYGQPPPMQQQGYGMQTPAPSMQQQQQPQYGMMQHQQYGQQASPLHQQQQQQQQPQYGQPPPLQQQPFGF
eukprot:CAMPEP_0172386876 /NCGR_PEP_ID=MMETSP1061-20121228/4331_1 /TAXON_ID=37318 /ORGANISM="Pseudo-nitzschia pungens, Strain cf. pungens" /LENGTH=704 /DNA_ID=CAMNT_0013116395 /DNA_START=384 /DNA_END=2498 /DNA_ORIENTATION=-